MQRILTAAALALIFGATSAWAQRQRAEIPFAFHVGDLELIAGTYQVAIGAPYQGTIMVRSLMTGEDQAVANFYTDQPQDRNAPQAKLVFNKYGSEYFLSQIWTVGRADSVKLPRSAHELVTSRLIAGAQPEEVVAWAAVRLP